MDTSSACWVVFPHAPSPAPECFSDLAHALLPSARKDAACWHCMLLPTLPLHHTWCFQMFLHLCIL